MADHATIIGQRIASLRKERKTTQAALAAAIGLTQARVAQMEAGKAISEHTLVTIAGALGSTEEHLTANLDKGPQTESERDTKCRVLVTAASSNVFAQAGLMVALGCVHGCKPASKRNAVDLIASYAAEYQIAGDKLAPILEFIKSGA